MKKPSRLKVIVFSYEREAMLRSLVKHLETNDIDFHVIDDGSSFDLWDFVPGDRFDQFNHDRQVPHRGKYDFWKRFEHAFSIVKDSQADTFLFMPDDFEDLQIDRVWKLVDAWKGKRYCVNLVNDGRSECWGRHSTGIKPIAFLDTQLIEVGFCDCGFICSRETLEEIYIDPVPDEWFDQHEEISSGVGAQLTRKMRNLGIPMLKPIKSLATHGSHPSKMHGSHRKETPLISR